jgi:hypothetical protein
MTTAVYNAYGTFSCNGSNVNWNLSAEYDNILIAKNVNRISHMDSSLLDHTKRKHAVTQVFTENQTFSTKIIVLDDSNEVFRIDLSYKNFGYTLSYGDWKLSGGNIALLLQKFADKEGLNFETLTYKLEPFTVTTLLYQPRGALHGSPCSGTSTSTNTSTNIKQVTQPEQTKQEEPADAFEGGMDIFGGSGGTGDY